MSPVFQKPPSFANALVQSLAVGNTMVLNKVARDLVVKASDYTPVVSHDWWCYQIITGAGGIVTYDKKPSLQYRQHDKNIVGANGGWKARYSRIFSILQGKFRTWNNINGQALQKK